MSIEASSTIHTNYVRLQCRGTLELKAIFDACSAAFDLAAGEGLGAILVDVLELQGPPPTRMQRFKIGKYVARLCLHFKKPVRLAVVAEEPNFDPRRFGETVARNRGAIVKAFTEIEEAEAWLER